MMGNDKNQMHPDDVRNLFIFFGLSILVYFAYQFLVLEPQLEATEQARKAQAELKQIEIIQPELLEKDKPLERAQVISGASRVKIDNGQIFGSISLEGGRIDDLSFTNYFDTLEKKDHVVLLSPAKTEFPRYTEHGWVSTDKNLAMPNSKTRWQADGARLSVGTPVTLYWQNPQGVRFERSYSIDENYLMTVSQKAVNNSGRKITIHPYGLVSQQGVPPDFQGRWVSYEGPIAFAGEVARDGYKKLRKEGAKKMAAQGGWIGITDKYWLTSLIPPQGQNINYSMNYAGTPPAKNQKDTGNYQVDFTGAALTLEPGQSGEVQSHIFAGAKKVMMLEDYEDELGIKGFDLAVDFGWFWFMGLPFFYILHYIGAFTGNMGIAIILLTCIIRGAVFPLTNTSYRSFAKMKKVQPQTLELRKQYGDDKKQLQAELVKMYEREGVNPLAGCLPIMMQIPIFFALYKVIFVTIEIRHAPFFGWIQDLSAPDPTTVFNLFGLIPWEPPGFLMIGVWPCLMLVAMIFQKKLNPPPQDPIQKDMANYMPFVMVYILSQFASGLVVYWTFSAYIGVIQQVVMMKSLGVPVHLFGETKAEKELDEEIEKGPAVHPLVEMAEDDVEEALFGDDDKPKKISPPKPKKSKKKKK